MKITGCETLHCDAGWRNFSFLKLLTDDGLVGIAEYNESYGSKGLTAVIEALVDTLLGVCPSTTCWATRYEPSCHSTGHIAATTG